MKKSLISLLLIGILIPFNTMFAASYGSSKSSSSSKSFSYSSKPSSYGSSSSSKSYSSGSSNYGSSSSYGSSSKNSKPSSYGSNSTYNVNNSTYGGSSNNTLKKVATGVAIGTTVGVAANEIQKTNTQVNSSTPIDVKKPELSAYEKMKADNISKNNSVNDNNTKTLSTSNVNNTNSSINNSTYTNKVSDNTTKPTNKEYVNNSTYKQNSNYGSTTNLPTYSYKNNNSNDYSYRRKVYHYDTSRPYGNNYNSYGVGNYYGHNTMDYFPAMMLVYMLSNSNNNNDYYAKQFYQENQNDLAMKQWREEMNEQSYNNKEVREMLYRLDNASKPLNYDSNDYSSRINDYSQKVSKDQKDYSSLNGTELKSESSDYVLKDELLFLAK